MLSDRPSGAGRREFLAASGAALVGLAGAGVPGEPPHGKVRGAEEKGARASGPQASPAPRMEIAEILPPPADRLWRLVK
jgi:hypothetical protein